MFNTIGSRISGLPHMQNANRPTDELPSYITNADNHTTMHYRETVNKFDSLKKEKDANDFYNKTLYKLYKEIHLKNGKTLAYSTKKAFKEAEEDCDSDLILPPVVLDPLIRAYEQMNDSLKTELEAAEGQVNKLAKIVEVLLEDNKTLREAIEKKERSIVEFVEKEKNYKEDNQKMIEDMRIAFKREIALLNDEIDRLNSIDQNMDKFKVNVENEKEKLISVSENYKLENERYKSKNKTFLEQNIKLESALTELREKFKDLEKEKVLLKNEKKGLKKVNKKLKEEAEKSKEKLDEYESIKISEKERNNDELEVIKRTLSKYEEQITVLRKENEELVKEKKDKENVDKNQPNNNIFESAQKNHNLNPNNLVFLSNLTEFNEKVVDSKHNSRISNQRQYKEEELLRGFQRPNRIKNRIFQNNNLI